MGEWAKFKRYHYLSKELPKQANCYGAFDGEQIVAFIGIIHYPNPRNKKIKKVSRLCVLPDYQGIGIGKQFLALVAKKYADEGFDVRITTSAKNLIYALRRDKNWTLVRYSVNKKTNTANIKYQKLNNTVRDNCKTASFYFKNG